jgi:hypothetical protein
MKTNQETNLFHFKSSNSLELRLVTSSLDLEHLSLLVSLGGLLSFRLGFLSLRYLGPLRFKTAGVAVRKQTHKQTNKH